MPYYPRLKLACGWACKGKVKGKEAHQIWENTEKPQFTDF